jgi:hypothetical protein
MNWIGCCGKRLSGLRRALCWPITRRDWRRPRKSWNQPVSEPTLELVPPEYECCFFDFDTRQQQSCLFVCWNLFANLVFLCKTGPITLSRRTLLCGRWLVAELKTVSDLRYCTWCKSGIETRPDTVPLICYIPTKHGFWVTSWPC